MLINNKPFIDKGPLGISISYLFETVLFQSNSTEVYQSFKAILSLRQVSKGTKALVETTYKKNSEQLFYWCPSEEHNNRWLALKFDFALAIKATLCLSALIIQENKLSSKAINQVINLVTFLALYGRTVSPKTENYNSLFQKLPLNVFSVNNKTPQEEIVPFENFLETLGKSDKDISNNFLKFCKTLKKENKDNQRIKDLFLILTEVFKVHDDPNKLLPNVSPKSNFKKILIIVSILICLLALILGFFLKTAK